MIDDSYQSAIENSNIVSKTDIKGIITFVNEEFCKISGYSYDELIGQNHNIVRHPDVPKESFKKLWTTILSKKPYKSTVKNLTKDGETVYLNTTITPILNKDLSIKEFIAIRYDVTREVELKKNLEQKEKELALLNKTLEQRVNKKTQELKELNKTLEQKVEEEVQKNEEKQKILFWQSRMASLGQMMANVAHQWRQPLTELSLVLFNLKNASKIQDTKKIETLYSDSKNIIANMSNTIEDFMNFFNPQKGKETFCIEKAVNESIHILDRTIKKYNININLEVKDECQVLGVSNELSQVIINLIQNSKDAFILKKIKDRQILINIEKILIQNKNFAYLSVKDNALGIDEKYHENIFEPYFTTKHGSQGTGLGLFMSKMIIEKGLNGTIEYKKIKDGSNFEIKIPLE